MSVSGVCGSADWAATQQAMGASQADGARRGYGDGDRGAGRTHEGHHGHRSHHGRHGGFVQAIKSVLDQLMAEAAAAATETPAADPAPDPTTDSATDTVTTDAVTPDATAADAMPTDGAATDTGASPWQVRHAFHAFIHTLFQTLAGAPAATGAPDADGDGDGTTAAEAAAGTDADGGAAAAPTMGMHHFAYGTPNMDLATLADGAAPDGGTGSDLSALQDRFQSLLDALGAGDSGITLQSFLQTLLDHLGGGAPATDPVATSGTLVEVSA